MMCQLKIYSFSSSSLKKLVETALKETQLPTLMDFTKFSRNYHLSKSVSLPWPDPVSAKIEGNLIFDPNNYLPKESMLKTTLTVFGFASADLFEVCLRLKRSYVLCSVLYNTMNRKSREPRASLGGTRNHLFEGCLFPLPWPSFIPARGLLKRDSLALMETQMSQRSPKAPNPKGTSWAVKSDRSGSNPKCASNSEFFV